MIKPETYYEVTCDECGEMFSDGDTIIAFGSKEEASKAVHEAGWMTPPAAGCVYCPECLEELSKKGRQ